MAYSVSEITYIPKDVFDPKEQSKPAVYLYYISKRCDYEKEKSMAIFLRNHPAFDYTDEEMIDMFKRYVNHIEHASTKSKILAFIKEFQSVYPGYIDDMETFPKYTVIDKSISNGVAPTPDKSLVWDMNIISPTITGMFFENMIAYALNMKDNCSDLSGCFNDDTTNTTTETIVNIVTRNFTLPTFIGHVILTNNKQLVIDASNLPLDEIHFRSRYHYIMFLSLIHFMKMDIRAEDYTGAIKCMHYVEDNISFFDQYLDELSHSTFVQWLRVNNYNLIHGLHIDQKPTRGEMDFISDRAIIDIKAYKIDDPDTWFAQLWQYKNMINRLGEGHGSIRTQGAWINQQDANDYNVCNNNEDRKLFILNMYSNRVYEFKY